MRGGPRETAPKNGGGSCKINTARRRNLLQTAIAPTAAARLGWALAKQGIDPAPLRLADDHSRPGVVVVQAPDRTAVRGLSAVRWDASAGKAVGLCGGSYEDMQEASAVLEALTAAGPGDLRLAPPEDPSDLWTVMVAAAWRLGITVRSRPANSGQRNMSALFALRDWLESDDAADIELKNSDVSVLMLLVLHMDRNGRGAFPGVARIARGVRLSPRTVETCLHRLRDARLIVGEVAHPRLGEAQKWRITDVFAAVLKDGSGATRQRAAHIAGAYAETTSELRASAYPKQKESKSSSGVEIDEVVLDLARAETTRRKAAGKKIDNEEAFARHIAREDHDDLLADEAKRQANVEAGAATEACQQCDRDGNLWYLPNGKAATRSDIETYSVPCKHAEPDPGDDVLRWATTNVMAIFPSAEVIEEAAG